MSIWIHVLSCISRLRFFFYFFFIHAQQLLGDSALFMYCSCTIYALFITVCTLFIRKKNIKNGFYGTIYIFKNYFVTVFLVFSFSKNKLYPNGPIIYEIWRLNSVRMGCKTHPIIDCHISILYKI